MYVLILLGLFAQPILPELPVPPELEAPTERPVVVPLRYDSLGVNINISSPLGFTTILRLDKDLISTRSLLSIQNRNDYYKGMEGVLDAFFLVNIGEFQINADLSGVSFSDTVEVEGISSKYFSRGGVTGLWHTGDILAVARLSGYSSTMTGDNQSSGIIDTRIYLENKVGRFLIRPTVRISDKEFDGLINLSYQRQIGFMLLTPQLQSLIDDGLDISAGYGLNWLAVLGNLSLEFDGYWNEQTAMCPDSALLEPVTAILDKGILDYTLTDYINIGAGYRGVDLVTFIERGDGFFWSYDHDQAAPLLINDQYSRTGSEVRVKLEQSGLSNVGAMRFYYTSSDLSWTPVWELADSLSLSSEFLEAFFIIEAAGDRQASGVHDFAYATLSCGLCMESQPFRVVVRIDDILDRKPQRWPGITSNGISFSAAVGMYSTSW